MEFWTWILYVRNKEVKMAGFNLPSFAQAATNLWSCEKTNKDLVAILEDEVNTDLILLHPYVMDNPIENDSEFFEFGDPSTGFSLMLGKRWYQKVYEEAGGGSLPYKIMGIARDVGGLPKAGCRAILYRSIDDIEAQETVTDSQGIYAFNVADTVTQYYVVVFQLSPPLSGISARTLTGA
jgi:hypothetical protein